MANVELPNGSNIGHAPHDSALSVGSSRDDAIRIRDLEDEVRILAEKANSASQRFADYENEIRVLEAKLRQEQRKNSAPALAKGDLPDGSSATASQPAERPGISRFGSFIGSRNKPSATQQNGALQSSASREKELEENLVKEQTTRIAAEKKIKEANAEIEDLTATLFQQANEMVATERKENAALREKLEVLEQQHEEQQQQNQKQLEQQQQKVPKDSASLVKENAKLKDKIETLERREADRKRRLDKLEAASRRIERVKAMLQPP